MKRVLFAFLLIAAVLGFGYLLNVAGSYSGASSEPRQATLPSPETSRARVAEPSVPPAPALPGQGENSETNPPLVPPALPPPAPPSDALQSRGIQLPIDGLEPGDIIDTFEEARGGGERRHEAVDLMAPRGTPVRAVVSGIVVKLFNSEAGGLTLYQFDASERHCFYYAHLDRYAEGIREGMLVKQGTVIGYAGSSGNADPSAPHLHFAVYELGPEKLWYTGNTPINPYPLLIDALKR